MERKIIIHSYDKVDKRSMKCELHKVMQKDFEWRQNQ